MQETRRNPENNEWLRCKKCGHKLFRLIQHDPTRLKVEEGPLTAKDDETVIEIKCHSCKTLNTVKM